METFEELYQGLNIGQKQAVDAIDGPVMVIAGPGTGKTQILATRILNILRLTDTNPENILCLTYTEAGATAMRQRLSKFMGTDSYRVNIFTFHGLCNQLIHENQDLFGHRDLRVMDDLERMVIIQELIDALPHDNPLKDYNPYSTHKHKQLLDVWTIMREQNLSAETIEGMVEQCKDPEYFKLHFPEMLYKRNFREFNKGDIKISEAKKLYAGWEQLIEAAKLLKYYQKKKSELGVYEFNDMIEWVHDEICKNEDFKHDAQIKFNYVLVDEFQDTSYLQSEIMHHLIDYHGDRPDCFVVGDDDQSIYAFQGARLSNMLEFKKRYSQALKTVVLTENYRSSQPILDASGHLIKKNLKRLVNSDKHLSKELVAAGGNRQFTQVEPIVNSYINEFHEVVGNITAISKLIENGVKPSDIAIIYTKHRYAEAYIDYLRVKDIPFIWDKSVNILELPIIQHLLDWLHYFSKESISPDSGEHLLFPLLNSSLYNIRPYALNQLSADIYESRDLQRRSGNYSPYSWRKHLENTLNDPTQATYLNSDEKAQLSKLISFIDETIRNKKLTTLGTFIGKILSEFGFISLASRNYEKWLLEVMHTFIGFVNEQSEKKPFMSLEELLEIMVTMKSGDIPILQERRFGSSNGVKLMSAHGSKGLEFDHVFIVRGLEKEWGQQSAKSYPYKLRDLLEGVNHDSEDDVSQALEERRRLFFVAVTRARNSLHISYHTRKLTDKKDSVVPSMFIGELIPEIVFEDIKPTPIPEESLTWAQEQLLLTNGKPAISGHIEDKIQERLDKFIFSPSSIRNILQCGLSFYYNNIIKVPSSPNEYLSYGNAIHQCMKHLVDLWVSKNIWLSIEEIQDHFTSRMNRIKGNFTEKQFESRLEQGKQLLNALITQKEEEYKGYRTVQTEQPIQSQVCGIPIKGSVDKLISIGDQAIVVDYKTGTLNNIKSKSKLSSRYKGDKVPSDYWLQVGIYCLMIEENPSMRWTKVSGVIEPMIENEEGKFESIELNFTQEERQIIKDWLVKAQERLETKSFLQGCGKKECNWCRFAKSTDWVRYLPNEQIEL